MNTPIRHTRPSATKLNDLVVLLPLSMAFFLTLFLTLMGTAHANEPVQGSQLGGIIDGPAPIVSNTLASADQLKAQVNKEQEELAKKDRDELEALANKGERLAQVALGADFANEAQQILFAPVAANSAISDALAWYALAAQRGYPGSPSLNNSGVKFHPVRVVRNR